MKPRKTTFEERCAEMKARLNPAPITVESPVDFHELFLPIVDSRLYHLMCGHYEITVRIRARLWLDRSTGHYRKPDITILRKEWGKGKVFFPVAIVEIKSPDDTFDNIIDSCLDYEGLAVTNILVMDPYNRRAWFFIRGSLHLIDRASVELAFAHNRKVVFPITQLFADLEAAKNRKVLEVETFNRWKAKDRGIDKNTHPDNERETGDG